MENLTTENKLMMGHMFNLKLLSEEERAEQIKELLKKGYSYGKLSALLRIPKTTLLGWANPEQKSKYYEKQNMISEINKEVQKKYELYGTPGNKNQDDEKFKEIAKLNYQLRTILSILKDIKEIDNNIAKKMFKEIKIEVHRLNGNEK